MRVETVNGWKNKIAGTGVWISLVIIYPIMGKSPGRWIKTVLFGKKSSKSHTAKRREVAFPLSLRPPLLLITSWHLPNY